MRQTSPIWKRSRQLSLPSWPLSTLIESPVHLENSSSALGVAVKSVRWRLLALNLLLSLLVPLLQPLSTSHLLPACFTLHLFHSVSSSHSISDSLSLCWSFVTFSLSLCSIPFFFFSASSQTQPSGQEERGKKDKSPVESCFWRIWPKLTFFECVTINFFFTLRQKKV